MFLSWTFCWKSFLNRHVWQGLIGGALVAVSGALNDLKLCIWMISGWSSRSLEILECKHIMKKYIWSCNKLCYIYIYVSFLGGRTSWFCVSKFFWDEKGRSSCWKKCCMRMTWQFFHDFWCCCCPCLEGPILSFYIWNDAWACSPVFGGSRRGDVLGRKLCSFTCNQLDSHCLCGWVVGRTTNFQVSTVNSKCRNLSIQEFRLKNSISYACRDISDTLSSRYQWYLIMAPKRIIHSYGTVTRVFFIWGL